MAEIRINAAGELKLYDSDDSNYVSFKSAGTVSSDITWTLPSADGSSGQVLSTNGSGTLSWATASSADPSSADGDSLGTASAEWSDLYLADGGIVYFGNDQDIRLTHNADKGLIIKHSATADDKPVSLTLQTGETDMAANDVIGKIDFQAPDEGTGTDAVLVAAGIEAISEGDFSSSANATKLSFKTAASEAAAEKMSLSSAGLLTVANGVTLSDGDVTLANGHGISFAATGDGSSTMSNELLDDYEEGTWTPTFRNYGGTDQNASGEYTKIGELVIAGGRIGTDGTSDGSTIEITGLPYTISNDPAINGHGGANVNFTTGMAGHLWQCVNNTTYIQANDPDGDGMNYNDFGANKEVRFTIIYKVA